MAERECNKEKRVNEVAHSQPNVKKVNAIRANPNGNRAERREVKRQERQKGK